LLNAARALSLNSESGKKLPEVEALFGLYQNGLVFRHGQVVMIAGRSGSQKSGFALWLCDELGLDTLYFSADMSAFTASSRLASKRAGLTTEEVEAALLEKGAHADAVFEAVEESRIQFSFGSPISWRQVDEELDAYVELHNKFPEIVIFDNLMDFEGAESDYTAQMAVMQGVTELSRDTGATVIVMHHASDKAWEAKTDPWSPPSRDQIKGGLSEKPEVSLSVALDPNTLDFNVAVVKQRMGPQDPSARRWVTLRCEPQLTRFHKKGL
jgi:hypothetical protein